MTMQMFDNFSYRGKRAEAIAISRRFSFTPVSNFGIATAAWGTCNYRGFWCDYVIDEMFVLSNLYLFSKTHDIRPSMEKRQRKYRNSSGFLNRSTARQKRKDDIQMDSPCNTEVSTILMSIPGELS